MKSKKLRRSACYCGSGEQFSDCCEPFIRRQKDAPTAEHLMRSRYSAFCCLEREYLLDTWHSSQRPATLEFDPACKWIGLDILDVRDSEKAHEVEFIARFKIQGKAEKLHERSCFVKENGAWRYLGATET